MDARTYNMLKAMLSTLHSDERAPYDRAPKRRNNIASLCATGNNERFLINDQGTRRMLVFRVEVVKPPIDYPFNYEGIYAQAYYLMQSGFQYYFSKEEQAELERHNKQFELESLLENAVESVFRKPTGDEVGEWFRPGQIAILLQQRYHIRFDENKIGMVMTTLGFQAWGYGLRQSILAVSGTVLERQTREGERPVHENQRELAGSRAPYISICLFSPHSTNTSRSFAIPFDRGNHRPAISFRKCQHT
jgi:hypothetical protein